MSDLPFGPDAVAAIAAHMNGDHAEDNVLICRAFGDVEPSSALVTGLDAQALVFTAVVDGGDAEVRVPWSAPLKDRVQVRHEVVRMYQEACAKLGVEPRGH
ncbi:DUF2470 domain-containing protein [Actinocorallia sp. A-T 12471]|uniref:DUF2470 domain-containing protein n=1 Tax=Actinocorallia sp. A-T 12471 TaxID=3089813 RepID=UPI0029CFD1CB|nr:DUF2470 domain-containing protein [Actinocorallia sp. A-T 12471]MDX6740281.1 DUF2470 domain-containing protein [Actinocorallia sp. A-T 12471]